MRKCYCNVNAHYCCGSLNITEEHTQGRDQQELDVLRSFSSYVNEEAVLRCPVTRVLRVLTHGVQTKQLLDTQRRLEYSFGSVRSNHAYDSFGRHVGECRCRTIVLAPFRRKLWQLHTQSSSTNLDQVILIRLEYIEQDLEWRQFWTPSFDCIRFCFSQESGERSTDAEVVEKKVV